MARIIQNKPFPNQPNIRRGAGPVNYTWNALPFQKGGVITGTKHGITCNNTIDNIVTYVYDILPDGNHLAYVYCDYVM